MIASNLKRNKAIFELWEAGLTVNQISSRTSIPRSTVGYYVRKFNKLALNGKPIVLPEEQKVTSTRKASPFSTFYELMKEMPVKQLRVNMLKMLVDNRYEELYYLLMDLKLIKELGSIVTSETFEKAIESIVPKLAQEED